MMRQGLVKSSTRGGADESLLEQKLDGRLKSAYSLRMAIGVHLAVILSRDEAISDLVTFSFVAVRLLLVGRLHSSVVAELLCLIERLEELHTEVQGVISSHHLSMTRFYDVSRRWSQYLNRCVTASDSEVVEAPGCSSPFSLKPIMVYLKGGGYIGPILPISLADLVAGRRSAGGGAPRSGGNDGNGGGGGRGNKKPTPKVGATGGPA